MAFRILFNPLIMKLNNREHAGTVHPRAGGEHLDRKRWNYYTAGSSPRWRGTPRLHGRVCNPLRFIPARAGNTPRDRSLSSRASVHPRAGGEHLDSPIVNSTIVGSSPRGRGTHGLGSRLLAYCRFIPALAGNTNATRRGRRPSSVHPRAGGEHGALIAYLFAPDGSSPRGRGTRVHCRCRRIE